MDTTTDNAEPIRTSSEPVEAPAIPARTASVSPALRAAVAAMIGVEPGEIPQEANLVHLGLGSLEMMRLVSRWRRDGVPVSFRDLAAEPTLTAWQRHLEALDTARVDGSGNGAP